ncbi:MAG TPA: hypothetical protein VL981_02725 [Candidatus Methylacidiphilales bacterium]|nr:hypothetical protein [Candidatus Methylacidiphilales bacterium]
MPLSPGRLGEDGQPLLCFGAALVASHLELLQGGEAAKNFANFIVRQASSEAIVEKARTTGFPIASCQRAIAYNDSYFDADRKAAVLDHLSRSS